MSLITVGARICWLLVLLPSPVWAGTLWPMTLLERSWECDLSHHTCCWVKLYLKGCGPWLCPHSIPEGLRPLVVRFRQVPFSILYWRCSLATEACRRLVLPLPLSSNLCSSTVAGKKAVRFITTRSPTGTSQVKVPTTLGSLKLWWGFQWVSVPLQGPRPEAGANRLRLNLEILLEPSFLFPAWIIAL